MDSIDSDHVTLFCGPERFDPTWFTEDAEELCPQGTTVDSLASSDAYLQGEKKISSSSRRELEDELGWLVSCLCLKTAVQMPCCAFDDV